MFFGQKAINIKILSVSVFKIVVGFFVYILAWNIYKYYKCVNTLTQQFHF